MSISTSLPRTAGLAASMLAAHPSLGWAEETPDLLVGSSFWGRYELRENYDRLGASRGRFIEGDWLVYRARLDLVTTPMAIGDGGLEASLFFSPQADGFWGNQPGTVATPNLGIYRGFLRLGLGEARLDLGRFDLDYGDALVIGDLRWHQTGRSFDGARARLGSGPTWVDVFVTQLDEGLRLGVGAEDPFAPADNPAPFEGDVAFGGIYGSIGRLFGEETTLEPYLLGQVWFADGGAQRPAVQGTLGIRALQRVGVLDFRLETGLQLGRRRIANGENPEVFAWQADGEVGLTPASGFRVALQALYATGDDPDTDTLEAWDELFPTTHKFLGLMDIIGIRTNVASAVAHVSWKNGPVLLKVDTHGFLRPETAPDQASFAGVETDVNLIYKFGGGLDARAMYAFFVPNRDHGWAGPDGTPEDAIAHYVELQLSFELGLR